MVALSGQMQDFIPVDCEGNPVRPVILYSDQRAEKQAKEIIRKIGEDTVTGITGNSFNGQMPFAKILWMKHMEPDEYEKTKCVLMSSKDYIIKKLTGKNVTDVTTASTSGIMNIRDCVWMYEWAEKLEVEASLLPELLFSDDAAGYISKHASESTGLCVGIPVLCGAGDGGSTSVGAGAVNEGEIYAYIGTTGWIAASTGSIGIRNQGVFQLAHMPRKTYIAVAPLLNAGNVHKWIASVFNNNSTGVKSETYKLIEQQVEKSKPGSEGLLFLPYLNGELQMYAKLRCLSRRMPTFYLHWEQLHLHVSGLAG